MLDRGWKQPDIIIVTGDAYIDHPSFGTAIISRVLENEGYTVGIIAQRLVRRLCPNCKKPHKLEDYEMAYLGITPEEAETVSVHEPVGCQRCNGTGYYDRIGIYEIMEITPTLRGMIARNRPTDEIRDTAIAEGMETLHASARRLVLDGTTSISEMRRVSVADITLLVDEPGEGA